MIGFIGQRQTVDAGGGLLYQRIRLRNDEERNHWLGIFPPDEPFRAIFDGMRMHLNPAKNPAAVVIFQGPEERDEWGKVFVQSPNFNHFAKWETPHMLLVGSVPAPVAEGHVEPEEPKPRGEEEWRMLSDKFLRQEAAEMGVPNIDPKESREMLISRMKRWQAEQVPAA